MIAVARRKKYVLNVEVDGVEVHRVRGESTR